MLPGVPKCPLWILMIMILVTRMMTMVITMIRMTPLYLNDVSYWCLPMMPYASSNYS